jgi:iron(III) transport system substrate-binding protein
MTMPPQLHPPAAPAVVRRSLLGAAAALAGLHALPAWAQGAASAQAQAPAADPHLVERARREGGLTLYGSMAEKDLQLLVEAFKARYRVEVNVWRSGKNKVLQRATAEARAGRRAVDIVHNPAPEMDALRQEGGLQSLRLPVQDTLMGLAVPAHREWVALRVYLFVLAYNTEKVKADELPKRWQDLFHPRWKGRLGIEAKDQEWFATLARSLGEPRGIKLIADIAAANGLSVRNGHSLLNNMVVSGEVPVAIATYSYLPEQARRRGAPVNWLVLPPAIAYTDGIGIARDAPRPNAARLFYEFALTEGLPLLAQQAHITTQRSSEAFLKPLQPVMIDPVAVLADYDKWTSIYEAAIAGRVSN